MNKPIKAEHIRLIESYIKRLTKFFKEFANNEATEINFSSEEIRKIDKVVSILSRLESKEF